MDLTLGRVQTVLAALNLPRPDLTVQIVGTNGKGSNAAFLEALCTAHGVPVGLHSSPHLVHFRERVRVDGRTASEADILAAADRLYDVPEAQALTYFEVATVIAAIRFAKAGVQVAIHEAGLGGKSDATTALSRDMVLATPVGLDHEAVLGPDIATIALDKTGAFAGVGTLLAAPQPPEVRAVFDATGAVQYIDPLPPEVPLGLAGPHQAVNAGLALAGFRDIAGRLGIAPGESRIRAGLAAAFVPARLQRIPATKKRPPILLDGAHNEPGLAALNTALDALDVKPAALVFAVMADKNVPRMVEIALTLTDGPILLPRLADLGRACPPETLAAMFGPRAAVFDSLESALDALDALGGLGGLVQADRAPVLVAGSLYLAGAFLTLHPEALDAPTP